MSDFEIIALVILAFAFKLIFGIVSRQKKLAKKRDLEAQWFEDEARTSMPAPPPAPPSMPPVSQQGQAEAGEFSQVTKGSQIPVCPVCELTVDGTSKKCPACGAVHHPECFTLNGGCGKCGYKI